MTTNNVLTTSQREAIILELYGSKATAQEQCLAIAIEQAAIAHFSGTTGQYITNDETRQAAIDEAITQDRQIRLAQAKARVKMEHGVGTEAFLEQHRQSRGEPVLDALKGMQRFFGKWPEFVPAPEYIGDADEAVRRMNNALSAPHPAEPTVKDSLTTAGPVVPPVWVTAQYGGKFDGHDSRTGLPPWLERVPRNHAWSPSSPPSR